MLFTKGKMFVAMMFQVRVIYMILNTKPMTEIKPQLLHVLLSIAASYIIYIIYSPHVKDYAVVWLDNFLERLLRPSDRRPTTSSTDGVLISPVTMMKVRFFLVLLRTGHICNIVHAQGLFSYLLIEARRSF